MINISRLIIFLFQQNRDQWRIVFYITAGIYLFGMLFYLGFAKGEVQEWAITEPEETNFQLDVINNYGSDIPASQNRLQES